MDERKECEITLSLSKEECKLLALKAEVKNMTVEELFQQFVADLVDDSYEHDYDQRQLVQVWYNQAFDSRNGNDYNFVQYLLGTEFGLEEYLENVDEIEEVSLLGEGEFTNSASDDIEICEKVLRAYYSDYEEECEGIGAEAEPFEEAHKRVIEWRKTSLYK